MDWSEIRSYIDKARSYPLLTREQEIELVHTFQAGVKARKRLSTVEGLSQEEKELLSAKVVAGDQARETFINANLRLVMSIAKKYKRSMHGIADIVQEGNIGLLKALERFNPELGFKFSTYASWWIRQFISRALLQGDLIRIPVYKSDIISRIWRVESELLSQSGEMSDAEIAEYLGTSAKEVAKARYVPHVTRSLDAPITEGDDPMIDIIEDEETIDAEREVTLTEIQGKIDFLFEGFSERDLTIFKMRFGEDNASLEQISAVIGVTRERVRQIMLKHLRTLRERARDLDLG